MEKIRFATTFGGSAYTEESDEYHEAVLLGQALTKLGYTVKCGGYYGLMEAISKGVALAKGTSVGVTNASFDPKSANEFIYKELKCNDIFDRLRELIKDSEIFIVQHGSLGTLTELFLVWCLCYTKTLENRRIYLLGKAWKLVIESLKNLPIEEKEYKYIEVFEDINSFIQELNTFEEYQDKSS